MPHLKCTLPNASNKINGIEFKPAEDGGVISVAPLTEEQIALFAGIRGYEVLVDKADFETAAGLRAESELAKDAGLPGYAATLETASRNVETKVYTDGTVVTGTAPLPELSPYQQAAAEEKPAAAPEGTGATLAAASAAAESPAAASEAPAAASEAPAAASEAPAAAVAKPAAAKPAATAKPKATAKK
jgi:hypothetical protein